MVGQFSCSSLSIGITGPKKLNIARTWEKIKGAWRALMALSSTCLRFFRSGCLSASIQEKVQWRTLTKLRAGLVTQMSNKSIEKPSSARAFPDCDPTHECVEIANKSKKWKKCLRSTKMSKKFDTGMCRLWHLVKSNSLAFAFWTISHRQQGVDKLFFLSKTVQNQESSPLLSNTRGHPAQKNWHQ